MINYVSVEDITACRSNTVHDHLDDKSDTFYKLLKVIVVKYEMLEDESRHYLSA